MEAPSDSHPLYDALSVGHIRILRLEGTSLVERSDPVSGQATFADLAINCRLETVSMDDVNSGVVSYNALSYCWGLSLEQECRYVRCNGVVTTVSTNLFAALWQLVFSPNAEYRDAPLWIDALCIDQRNLQEKRHQVGMMGEIYKAAAKVLAWLGPLPGSADSSFATFWDMMCRDEVDFDQPFLILAGRKLIQSSGWFDRMWTFQEIVLAKEAVVLFGPFSVDWDDLNAFWRSSARVLPMQGTKYDVNINYETKVNDNYGDELPGPLELSLFTRMARIHAPDLAIGHLTTLLEGTCGRRSSDPRDRIYALLGLYQGSDGMLVADYELPETVVRAQAAFIVLQETQRSSLDILEDRLPELNLHGRSNNLWAHYKGVSWIPPEEMFNDPQGPLFGYKDLKLSSDTPGEGEVDSLERLPRLVGSDFMCPGVVLGLYQWNVSGRESEETDEADAESLPACANCPTFDRLLDLYAIARPHPEFDAALKMAMQVQSARTLHEQIELHQSGACDCDQPQDMGQEIVEERTFWLCLLWVSDAPVLLEPFSDPETQDVSFRAIGRVWDPSKLRRSSVMNTLKSAELNEYFKKDWIKSIRNYNDAFLGWNWRTTALRIM